MTIKRVWQGVEAILHALVLLMSLLLIFTSPWILIGRQLTDRAGFWDLFHVYGGLLTAILAVLFLIKVCNGGQWRLFFPWLTRDIKPLLADVRGLLRGQLPHSGGKGLISVIEGLGVIILLLVAMTGVAWFVAEPVNALAWRHYHIVFVHAFIGFIVVHCLLALLHIRAFFD
ncbi:cytochrome b/b6 domain-containing protein [Shewanella inventionis]|uniref:cytochrome b/b6 domain-containing protein n=1 Tax=Shewanella inventionis TaxID=1738770 RepID=UPI001CBAA291|nr:cytochrome b/b6 domain-containing protein [Shewanella inventionis]UAL44510.1 cytochrome b/b6 domain-containing protein [Shewanella inventionis]